MLLRSPGLLKLMIISRESKIWKLPFYCWLTTFLVCCLSLIWELMLVLIRYADRINAYWTGYFTSRPAIKRYVRILSGYYLVGHLLFYLN